MIKLTMSVNVTHWWKIGSTADWVGKLIIFYVDIDKIGWYISAIFQFCTWYMHVLNLMDIDVWFIWIIEKSYTISSIRSKTSCWHVTRGWMDSVDKVGRNSDRSSTWSIYKSSSWNALTSRVNDCFFHLTALWNIFLTFCGWISLHNEPPDTNT